MRLCFTFLIFLACSSLSLNGEENFILIKEATNEIITNFGSGVEERVTPACSFNIALSLMGYDQKILQNEHTPMWNFEEGYDDFSDQWKQSQTPLTWMERSCVWFSKIVSLHLGQETIGKYLDLFDYGNQNFSTGLVLPGPLNPAWVSSSLKISPLEQVEFLKKMIRRELPVSDHSFKMTRKILFKEELGPDWKLFGKTGLGSVNDKDGSNVRIRWFVGWVEKGLDFFPFAYLQQEAEIDISQTVPRVKKLLEEANLWFSGV